MSKYRNIDPGTEGEGFSWNEESFSVLFDDYYASLCFYANKYLEDINLARSLVQEVFVDLWTKRNVITFKYSVKSYLYRAVRNKSIDYLRASKRNVRLSELSENDFQSPFHDIIEEAELNARINQAINALPEKCRQVFVLCRFEGLKYKQIAGRLGISEKTVSMQMGIALRKMRKKLSDIQSFNFLLFLFF